MNKFTFKDLQIEHTIKKGMKNSYIKISDDAQIILTTPHVSKAFVKNLLQDKEPWIRKKLFLIKENPPLEVKMTEQVLLFGEVYAIDAPQVIALKHKLEKANSTDKIHKCYNDFYKEYAREYIIPRVEHFSQIMGLNYTEIKFRKMKSRWGSCSSKKTLTFNTQLMQTKKELIDYVVVHELAHLKHMDHSKDFHALVEKFLANSQYFRKELQKTKINT